MNLATELGSIERELLAQVSEKERAFYFYIRGDPESYSSQAGRASAQEVCLATFSGGGPDVSEEVDALRRGQAIAGMHYSENPIELFAVALHRPSDELPAVREHCRRRGWREYVIFKRIYPELSLEMREPESATEKLAKCIYEDRIPANWKVLVTDSLKSVEDVVDLVILNDFAELVLDYHPITTQVETVKDLIATLEKFILTEEARAKKGFHGIAVVSLGGLGVLVAYLSLEHWNVAEPLLGAFGVIGALILVGMGAIRDQHVDKVKVIRRLKELWVVGHFRRLGFPRNTVEAHIARLREHIDSDSIEVTGPARSPSARQHSHVADNNQ